MTLGDDVAAGLPGLRAGAESRMHDTFQIARGTTQEFNPVTYQYDDVPVVIYTGPGRLRPTTLMDHGSNAGDQAFIESQYVLSLPIDTSGDVRKDDVATCTASATDADMVGRKYTVVIGPSHSDATARRFPVRETQ